MWRPCGKFDDTYKKDMAIVRTPFHWIILLTVILFLYLFPLLNIYVATYFMNYVNIYIVAALGLQIVTGYCGQISFGQPAFMAVGAFASAFLATHYGISFWLLLPISGLIAGIIGTIGGAPSLRMKGFYLAMATIAIHFVIMWLLAHMQITRGLTVSPAQFGNFAFNTDERMYYIILSVMLIMTFAARNLVRCKVGRAFVAIRDNDRAANVMGINVYYYKLIAFFISCFYAGVSGCLWAHWIIAIHVEQFTFLHALWFIGMLIIGGMGSIPGVFFGVITIRLLDEFVMYISPFLAANFPEMGMAPAAALGVTTFGLVMVGFLLFEPRGMAHRWEVIKASLRLYPFAR